MHLFPETSWSRFLKTNDYNDIQEFIISYYMNAIYSYLQIYGKVNEPEDIAHEFIVAKFSKDSFFNKIVDKKKKDSGFRFTPYLVQSLKFFVIDYHKGKVGSKIRVSISLEENLILEKRAENSFYRAWAKDIFKRALAECRELMQTKENGMRDFLIFSSHYEGKNHSEIAQKNQVSIGQVRSIKNRLTKDFQKIVMNILKDGVTNQRELEEEFQELMKYI